ncbi:MAG: PTS sugar transporter subunit IIA [Actinomycetota bacterium]
MDGRVALDLAVAARVRVDVSGWRDGIRAACHPLVDAGAFEQRYEDRCVAIVEEQGPYIVLAPGIALAHARPEDGVRRLGLGVAVLQNPVAFGHAVNDPVDLVLAFGSPDRGSHVGLLSALAGALLAGLAGRLREAPSDAAARELLEGVIGDDV